jgi:hypothetical protein
MMDDGGELITASIRKEKNFISRHISTYNACRCEEKSI